MKHTILVAQVWSLWVATIVSWPLDVASQSLEPASAARLFAMHVPKTADRVVVLLRQPRNGMHTASTLAPEMLQDLETTARVRVKSASPHPSGGQALLLETPTSIEEAKRIIGRLRMRADVLWAELDPGNLETSGQMTARAVTLSAVAEVRQLMVRLGDAETQRRSRANEKLSSEWDDLISAAAGVELHVVRATVGGGWLVALPNALSYADAAAIGVKLVKSGLALHADPDAPVHATLVPNDPGYVQAPQADLYDPHATPYFGIDAPQAWDITTGDPNLVIAVVDTGVLPHPEFGSRLLQGYDFISNPANSHDGLGPHASGTDPGNWRSATDCPGKPAANSSWHGTHVAGTIAATGNNGTGIAGINWRSKILPVRVLGTCGGTTSDILTGMLWAAGAPVPGAPVNDNPARVINMSLGGPGTCTPQFQALVNEVLEHGTLIVAAAGNDDGDANNAVPGACFGLSTVGATGPYGDRAAYSNFSISLDISAPGGDPQNYPATNGYIWSTYNKGTDVPTTYAYAGGAGTSMATPHVAGVASLMLAVNPSLTPAQLKELMAQSASPFAAGSVCLTGICGAGIVSASGAVLAARALIGSSPPATNYTGLWWSYPEGGESGWGINLAHQGDIIFASWFTYDSTGKPWWLVMTAPKLALGGNDAYSGTLYKVIGPAFNSVPFNTAEVVATPVGTGLLIFDDPGTASFIYTVNGVTQAKTITPQVFGPLPTCTFGAEPNLASATNYTDLWWATPPRSESGWGINLTHQGTTIFATWFTFDFDGSPLWLVVTAQQTSPNAYSGTLQQTSGPPFSATPFNPALVTTAPVGSATFTFANGNAATFAYTAKGVTQTKQIVREVLTSPGTTCH